ncbi:MAG TPA: hypothetical protein VF747_08485 [Blastocatellia bacterium]
MKTQRNMKATRSLFRTVALSALVWIIGGLVWNGIPVQAASIDSTISIPVSGTVTQADGTKITFGGSVTVRSSAVTDVAGIPPFVMLTFDCSTVTATSGSGANKKTYDTKGYQVTKIRDLQASDVIVMTAPVLQTGSGVLTANPVQVTATLNFNVTTGVLTSGTLTVGNNTFSSSV